MGLRLIGIVELEFLHPSAYGVKLLRSLDELIQIRPVTMTADLRCLECFQPCAPLASKHRQQLCYFNIFWDY